VCLRSRLLNIAFFDGHLFVCERLQSVRHNIRLCADRASRPSYAEGKYSYILSHSVSLFSKFGVLIVSLQHALKMALSNKQKHFSS
jgi:prepilin-type processing-associated H-X9-DG protein